MLKIRFKNKKYSAVWLVEPSIGIGRSRANELVVSAPDIADKHLTVEVNHEALELVNLVPGSSVSVNGEKVGERTKIKPGDVISLASIELEIIDPKDDSVTSESSRQSTNPRNPVSTGWALKANHTALGNRVYPLQADNIVGRSSDCDITLAAAHLSRRHARLDVKQGVLYVKDLGSANGTYLNGKAITEARVKRGDELRFDTLSFGVIGPADDMAQTTIRAAGKAAGPRPAAPRPAAKANNAHSGADASLKKEVESSEAQNPRFATAGMGVLVVLAIIVVAALFLTRG
ncbi:FHA domain-containing protein [Gilvimarinus agarilyticus]|uniref:FHA domain-containing protein n=1 Tax=unclassified Gilvimarinus TaxID=2642066 RepID=UPI001C0909B1|nr:MULTISPECIES: FHA domain-containing protein [unclassified Gilvimarinus]MBU2885118.1 FHA domain-containing protein [Gilvimarinus agarilyticus]MDO6570016.1 FHA domain-containing protein [Gilvimarinus sp. 2_MG-2023]MDO6747283.1 FHA domain-containing protein [Gilvimarinus sp. 1_MG-2023]